MSEEPQFVQLPESEKLPPTFQNRPQPTEKSFLEALAKSYKTTPDKIRVQISNDVKVYYFGDLVIFRERNF